MTAVTNFSEILDWLREVKDPEVPAVDVVGMGIVRHAEADEEEARVTITPTYSGCPAMQVIEREIQTTLEKRGFARVIVKTVLAPAWTTDWMEEETRAQLKAYGIAPPAKTCNTSPFQDNDEKVSCPFCDHSEVSLRSRFGSTACKALYYCNGCHQPFEQFKCI